MLFNSMTALAEEVTPTATTAAGGEFISMIIMLVVMFGILYFMMIRPQKKKEKAVKNMLDASSAAIASALSAVCMALSSL